MIYWRDSDTMEAEEELAALQNPVSLPILVSKAPAIDLLSSIPEEPEIPEYPIGIFPVFGLKGIPEGSTAQNVPRLSKPRSGTSVGFDGDALAHPGFHFGEAHTSRPQVFSYVTSLAQPAWPQPLEVMNVVAV